MSASTSCSLPDREDRRAEQAHDERAIAYQSRPGGRGRAGGDAEPVAEQHERAFAHAEAAERHRDHLQHRHRRDERERGRDRHRHVERAEDQRVRRRRSTAGRRARSPSTRSIWRGVAAGAVDTLEHRADEARPVLVAREAAREPGWPAANRISAEHAERRRRDEQREPRVLDVEQRRPRAAKPTITSSGSAIIPLSRSSTTDANAVVVESTFFAAAGDAHDVAADVDGRTLLTNWPAR